MLPNYAITFTFCVLYLKGLWGKRRFPTIDVTVAKEDCIYIAGQR
jgi:hypothetical protein